MNIVLISTSSVSAGRAQALDRMLASVADAAGVLPDLTLLLLLQDCPSGPRAVQDLPTFVDVSTIPDHVSLSAARNILLSRALARRLIGPDTMVGFPDDDCWYPRGTLESIADEFASARDLDLWFCRYGSKPVAVGETDAGARGARARDVIRQASSNTMFVRGRLIRAGLTFDERLGVGTPVGGAEDTEFALRAHLSARRTMYLDAPAIGHRDKNAQLRAKYYRGGLVAIATHARKQNGVRVELIRKVAVGAWLTLRGELAPTRYLGDLAAGAHAWRSPDHGAHPV